MYRNFFHNGTTEVDTMVNKILHQNTKDCSYDGISGSDAVQSVSGYSPC